MSYSHEHKAGVSPISPDFSAWMAVCAAYFDEGNTLDVLDFCTQISKHLEDPCLHEDVTYFFAQLQNYLCARIVSTDQSATKELHPLQAVVRYERAAYLRGIRQSILNIAKSKQPEHRR